MSDQELLTIALRRAKTLCVEVADAQRRAGDASITEAVATSELARLGLAVHDTKLLAAVDAASWSSLIALAASARGEERAYAPLFVGFPNKLPSFDDAELRFALGLSRLVQGLSVSPNDPDIDWHARWSEASDLTSIGWWPASSVRQDATLDNDAKQAQTILQRDLSSAPWTVEVAPASQLREVLHTWTVEAFASPVPASEAIRLDLNRVLDEIGMDHLSPSEVPSVEMRAILTSRLWVSASAGDEAAKVQLKQLAMSPDDLLRSFAAVTGSDVSLFSPITIPKFSRPMRRLVMEILESSPRRRDVYRRRSLWLHVFKAVHAGEFQNKAPAAFALAQELRSQRYDRTSTRSRFEAAIANGEPVHAAMILQSEAPTLMARQLRRLLHVTSTAAEQNEILRLFGLASGSYPRRVLFQLRSQLRDNGATYPRVAFTKSGRPLIIDRQPGHLELEPAAQAKALDACEASIEAAIASLDVQIPGPLWIDPSCHQLLAPLQQRSLSDANRSVERGSRVSIAETPVLRLFIHWREPVGITSDLDLSVIALDSRFRYAGQVSWTNLANGAFVHSGDLTSAPYGASEFIDITVDAAKELGYRYVAPVVYRYSGPSFAGLPEAVIGWMPRTSTSSDYRTFDVATVDDHFRLDSKTAQIMPFVFDTETNEAIWVDVKAPGAQGLSVEGTASGIAGTAAYVARRAAFTPTVGEIVETYAKVMGLDIVENRSEANVTVGVDETCTYNIFQPAEFAATFM